MDMELTKKTTILFPPAMHDRLTRLAESRGTSLGELVRSACEREYAAATTEERIEAVRRLADLKLPVGSVRRMKLEAVPEPEDLAK
jgi:predicted DNA-binding protein